MDWHKAFQTKKLSPVKDAKYSALSTGLMLPLLVVVFFMFILSNEKPDLQARLGIGFYSMAATFFAGIIVLMYAADTLKNALDYFKLRKQGAAA